MLIITTDGNITKVGTNYKTLYETMSKHKVLSMIPDEMAEFLFQRKVESLYVFEKKDA